MNAFEILFFDGFNNNRQVVAVEDDQNSINALKVSIDDIKSITPICCHDGKAILASKGIKTNAAILDKINSLLSGTTCYFTGNTSSIIIDLDCYL